MNTDVVIRDGLCEAIRMVNNKRQILWFEQERSTLKGDHETVASCEAGRMILGRVVDHLWSQMRSLPVPRFNSGAVAS